LLKRRLLLLELRLLWLLPGITGLLWLLLPLHAGLLPCSGIAGLLPGITGLLWLLPGITGLLWLLLPLHGGLLPCSGIAGLLPGLCVYSSAATGTKLCIVI